MAQANATAGGHIGPQYLGESVYNAGSARNVTAGSELAGILSGQNPGYYSFGGQTYLYNPSTGGGGGGGGGGYGSSGATSSSASLLQAQLARMAQAYAERDAARQRAYDATGRARQMGYDRGATQANEVADRTLNESAIQRMMAERNLGQQLSAIGRSGGAAESTILNLNNAYGKQRGDTERTRADNLADLRLMLEQGLAQDTRDLELARADDAIARFESEASIMAQLDAAMQNQAAKQASVLSNQVYGGADDNSGLFSGNMNSAVNNRNILAQDDYGNGYDIYKLISSLG